MFRIQTTRKAHTQAKLPTNSIFKFRQSKLAILAIGFNIISSINKMKVVEKINTKLYGHTHICVFCDPTN